MSTLTQALAAWLMTYALHSTVLLGLAWLITRRWQLAPATTDVIWKVAMVGGLITATAQGALSLQPTGSFAIAASAPASALRGEGLPPVNGSRDPANPAVGAHDAVDPIGAALESGGTAELRATDPTTASSSRASGPRSFAASLSVPSLLAIGWFTVALLLVLGYLARRLVLLGRLGDRRLVGDRTVTELLDTLRDETGVTEPVRLTSSRAISSPVALGGGEICLPAAALEELAPEQQRAMLAHELAHLVRRDPQWLAASCVMERTFFFQPLNRLARRGIQDSAEYLADEWAARRAGGVPLARALVKVAEWIQASPLGVPVAGFAEERSQLTARVARLLDRSALGAPRSRWGVGLMAAAALLVMTAFAPGVAHTTGEVPYGEEADAMPQQPGVATAPAQSDTSIVAAVIERLRDEDADVRRAAADALGRMGNQSAIAPLVRALGDEDPEVSRAALHALGEFARGVPAAPIRRLLDAADSDMRAEAIELLGDLKDRSSIPAITRLVADPVADVRERALRTLEDLEAPIADATIDLALRDESPSVRETAAHVAGERRLVSAVPALIRMLEDASGSVRESAAEALTEMRTEASHRALRMALTHRDARVRRVAVEYLGEEDDR